MSKNVILNQDVEVTHTEWGSLQWLVTGKTGASEKLTVGRVTIKPNNANPHHYHPNCEEVLYVESGMIEHTLPDGGTVKMEKGDCIVIPKGIWHHARNIGNEDAVVIVSFDHAWRETIGED